MKAILEVEKGSFSSHPKFELIEIIEIDMASRQLNVGDVVFEKSGNAYSVQFVAHFQNGSYPVVEKVSRAYINCRIGSLESWR